MVDTVTSQATAQATALQEAALDDKRMKQWRLRCLRLVHRRQLGDKGTGRSDRPALRDVTGRAPLLSR